MGGEIFIETSKANRLAFPLPAQHLYLVFRDINGDEYVLRSGPEESFWPFGDMEIEVNVAMENSIDDRDGDSPEDRSSTALDFAGLTDDEAWAFMVKYARLIDDAGYDYKLLTENSNAFVGALLYSAGGTPFEQLPAGFDPDDFIGFSSWDNIVDDVAPPADNIFYGTSGDDLMAGLQIDETLMALGGDDVVRAGRGDDTLVGRRVMTPSDGGAGNDYLFGDAGNDYIDGGSGADRMEGGLGDDVYSRDNAGDVIVELATGTDRVHSGLDYTLTDNVRPHPRGNRRDRRDRQRA